jgi:hypothetical protein
MNGRPVVEAHDATTTISHGYAWEQKSAAAHIMKRMMRTFVLRIRVIPPVIQQFPENSLL